MYCSVRYDTKQDHKAGTNVVPNSNRMTRYHLVYTSTPNETARDWHGFRDGFGIPLDLSLQHFPSILPLLDSTSSINLIDT
ncbi:hypothetical protein GBA52_024932 [Prunus armeniaca]|nr:hypothetical protein GBA52_024932 [Prunus armeniaca]